MDLEVYNDLDGEVVVSIPESGFCLFGQRLRRMGLEDFVVSIPESGFCLFGPLARRDRSIDQ